MTINNLYRYLHYTMIFFLFLLSNPFAAFSQNKVEIKGYVKDADGKPLEGVTIVRKANENGTTTDAKGFFSLKLSNAKASLIFSYIGYATQTVKADDKAEMQVVMEKSVVNQDEVVVIGYGSAKRKDVTGAVSTIKPKTQDALQFNSVDNLLKGRVAGVQVQQSAGDPGGAVSVKIRGINSLRGDNEPLYVVDGVIINNVTRDNADPFSTKTANSGQTKQSGLAGINPLDIESIEILKDASATAIYGSRGANGVVIITTKQGKGKPIIRYTSFIEMSKASKKLPMLDAKGYASYINEIQALNGFAPKYRLDTLQDINWQNELQRTAISSNNRISVTGSSQDNKTKYFLAGGYLKSQGIVLRSGYNQGDLKLNLNQDISNKLKLNFTLSSVFLKNSMSQSTEALGGGDNSMIIKMLVAKPILNDQTALSDPSVPYDNPYSWIEGYDDYAEEKRVLSGLGLTYKFNNALSYKLNLAADYRTKERKRWFGKQTFNGKNVNGQLGLSQLERTFYQIENLLNYNKNFNRKHQLDGTFGVTYDNENLTLSSVINENFFSEALRTDGFGYGQVLYPYLRDRSGAEVFSILGRVNYGLKNKYILTISGRADGSSKFSKGNKFSIFPAVAAAWRISEEGFLKNSATITNLKLRAGYGKSGNQAIDPYGTFARYGQTYYVSGNTLISGAVPENIQNERLKWETTDQINAGLDVALFKNRFTATVDWYYKKTNDLLQTFAVPPSTGYNSIIKNIGTIENKGFEFNFTGLVIDKKDFSASIGGNISINRNKILDLGLDVSKFGIYDWEAYIGPNVSTGTYFKDPANIFVVGMPIGMFYGYKTNGVFQTGETIATVKQFGLSVQYGDTKFIDQNGDGDIGPADKVILGNPNPDFTFGFNAGVTFKNFTFDVFFNGTYGNQVANGNRMRIANANGNTFNNILADNYYNAWTAVKGSGLPRVGYNNLNFIDTYVEDASFMRLATATIGYNFLLNKNKFIKSIGVNITGKNLFTITNYSGFDPEVNSFSFDKGKIGVDWGSYPNLKSVSASVNITF
jgi:TonB-dependent starch-binding outer membrane protein SusC